MTKVEAVAQWYFRLNGFLTIPNFILHKRGGQRTEVDVIGIRFPHRFELDAADIDEPEYRKSKPYLILAEVKSSRIGVNESWAHPGKRVIEDILKAVGLHRSDDTSDVARELRDCGHHDGCEAYTSLCFIGDSIGERVRRQFAEDHCRLWDHILTFIHNRFSRFDRLKTQVDQWDDVGKELWKLSLIRDSGAFLREARKVFHLPKLDAP